MLKRANEIDWESVWANTTMPLTLLYSVTLGALTGWLQGTFLTGPDWKWYGPIPIHKRFSKWDRDNA